MQNKLNDINYFKNINRLLLIAEIGVNHNGDNKLAKELINSAIQTGADAVKFQTYKTECLASRKTPKVPYQELTTLASENHFQMLKKLELSFDDHLTLKNYCDSKSIKFLSTPYDVESATFLHEELDIEIFKTASADLIDLPLHEYIASTGKPSIISVGMATIDEIEDTLEIYKKAKNSNIILLHCVSNYPCTPSSLNLRNLRSLQDSFDLPIGFSDHSIGCEAAMLSVALGAKVIEKHFTLDKNLDGPDHLASSNPDEFKMLTNSIRLAEIMLGSKEKICQLEEIQMREISRKSISLRRDMIKGDVITKEDLCCLRPGYGISPMALPKVIGSTLKNDLSAETQLNWQHLMINS